MRSGSAVNRQILPRMRKQTVKIRRRALRFCDTIVCFSCPLPAKKNLYNTNDYNGVSIRSFQTI